MTDEPLDLADGVRRLGISEADLLTRCLALDGSMTADELELHLVARNCPDTHEHNVIAQALNDAFSEQGRDHPVGYLHLYSRRHTR